MWKALLILAGMVLRLTPLPVPVHEQMHVIAVHQTGGIVTYRDFDTVSFERSTSAEYVYFMGYGGEVILYGLLGLLPVVGPLFVGMVIDIPFIAVGSWDFSNVGPWGPWVIVGLALMALGLHILVRGKEWGSSVERFDSRLDGASTAAGRSAGTKCR